MWFELRAERRESEIRIAQLRLEVKNLRSEVKALGEDPLAMERAIREVLELARPGETVIRFVERDNGPASRLN
jgi:cell division protein FtsB